MKTWEQCFTSVMRQRLWTQLLQSDVCKAALPQPCSVWDALRLAGGLSDPGGLGGLDGLGGPRLQWCVFFLQFSLAARSRLRMCFLGNLSVVQPN